jgi:peptidoglycan hydrolase FlgJ
MEIGSSLPLHGSFPPSLDVSGHLLSADPESAKHLAGEFESVFMSLLLKTMRETASEEGLFAGDSSDTFGGMFDLFMSRHLSASNPLGIGNLVQSMIESRSPETTGGGPDGQQ